MRRTLGADAHLVLRVVLQETFDTAAGELFRRFDESVMVYICVLKGDTLKRRLRYDHTRSVWGEQRRVLGTHTWKSERIMRGLTHDVQRIQGNCSALT